MTTSLAAQIRVCLRFGILRVRVLWIAAMWLLFATVALGGPSHGPDSGAVPRFDSLSFDSDESAKVSSSSNSFAFQEQPQQGAVIDRIIFMGNRRVRSDTLKARIFSREGDPYNEETLRRDFQALWNTQFFEDVKLRVEDSPDGPNHKNIIFGKFTFSPENNHLFCAVIQINPFKSILIKLIFI